MMGKLVSLMNALIIYENQGLQSVLCSSKSSSERNNPLHAINAQNLDSSTVYCKSHINLRVDFIVPIVLPLSWFYHVSVMY